MSDDNAGQAPSVAGVVYVETDVRYESPEGDVATWAKGPLEEVAFVRRIVEGCYGLLDAALLVGIVLWAPMDQPTETLKTYLHLAEAKAGPEAWERVKGFRFLLQGFRDQAEFESLVSNDSFSQNLALLGDRGFSFDVGVDQRSGGIWQLEAMAKAMARAHHNVSEGRKVAFIINHLCKPDFSTSGNAFERWCSAVTAMSQCSRTYMKLSGAFSELPLEPHLSAADISAHLRPWLGHVFASFGPARVMFGSDWPVCNVRGPKGEDSWAVWKDVVQSALDDPAYGLDAQDKAHIWSKTATRAYRLQ